MSKHRSSVVKLVLFCHMSLAVFGLVGIWEIARSRSASAETVSDNRTVLPLNAEERSYVLENMRQHLTDIQGLIEALAADDRPGALHAAQNLGTLANKQITKRPKGMAAKFPDTFVALTQSFHTDFDDLANGIAQGETTSQAIRRLGIAINTCNSCHSSYKIEQPAL